MHTELVYLHDNASSCSARVVEVIEVDIPIVRLDRTIFHPITSSQRSDRGHVGNAHVLAVEFNSGTVDHYVDQVASLHPGLDVYLTLDAAWRLLQSTYQSAGHILAYAVERHLPHTLLIGGQHWPDHAVIWLRSNAALSDAEVAKIELEAHELIRQRLPVSYSIYDEMRFVQFGNLRKMKCRGTHLRSSQEIKSIEITRNFQQNGVLEIKYSAQYNPCRLEVNND